MQRVLMVVSEAGYNWDEVLEPYVVFKERGCAIALATPEGGVPKPDPRSVRVRRLTHRLGYGTSKRRTPESPRGCALRERLAEPLALADARAEAYDGFFIAGGHGALFDLNRDARLHALVLAFDAAGKRIGALCHGSSTLAFVDKDGAPLIQNRLVTGFPTALERLIRAAGMIEAGFSPRPIWTARELDKRSRKRSSVVRFKETLNPYYTVADGNLITGVGPKTGRRVAERMLE